MDRCEAVVIIIFWGVADRSINRPKLLQSVHNSVHCMDFPGFIYIGPGPVQYTIYWTALLTKTNNVNKNVKYNIHTYIYFKRNVIKNIL